MSLARFREERGYSMTELVIVMAILGIVVSGLTTVFVQGSRGEVDMNRRFTAQQNARSALSQLRTDIHVGCNATATSTTLLVYKLKSDGTCDTTPAIAWCTGTSANISTRLNLWEAAASSCSSPPAGKLFADYIVSGSTIFTLNTPTSGSKQRMSVAVDIPVNANKAITNLTTDRYELKDTIVLRNAPQA